MLLVTQASYSQSAIKALVDNPQDRHAAIDQMVQAAGGKLISLYMTSGESDILLINEFESSDPAIALGLVAAASGSITNVKTVRAWTTSEFKTVAQSANELAGSYTPPAS